jgi:predicted kinase
MSTKTTLHLFCGKMAAGKSTLARQLAKQHNAILLIEDDWLSKLYPEEITDITSYVTYSVRLKDILADHIQSILAHGTSLVLDFPANTKEQRNWLRILCEQENILHILHYVDVSDEVCKQQLKRRSRDLPKGSAFTSDAEFDEITRYFQIPSADEDFNIVEYKR